MDKTKVFDQCPRPLLEAQACPHCPPHSPRQRRAPAGASASATNQTNPPPDEPACRRCAARSRSTCYFSLTLTLAKRIRQSVGRRCHPLMPSMPEAKTGFYRTTFNIQFNYWINSSTLRSFDRKCAMFSISRAENMGVTYVP